jgi:hypothetical protein
MRFWIVLLFACGLFAATSKLYLKDGTYQLVREYQVSGDRVKYYSVERSDWEEIPLDLVDLKRTEAEIKQHVEALEKDASEMAAEDKVEREQADELARVPQETGVYLVQGGKLDLKLIPQAESKVVTNKKRSVLKVLSPIPMVAGKATVEIDGASSKNVISNERPEFYIRLAQEERFGIFKLKPGKGVRVVQTWSVVPVANETVEDQQEVPVFRRELADGLYKIWPEKPLEPGEYAVVEYTEGKRNIQVWDFGYRK